MKELKITTSTHNPHPEVIKWGDAQSIMVDMNIEEIEYSKMQEAITVGIVMHEDKDKVAICQTQFLDTDHCFRKVLYIPKVMIIERFKLKAIKGGKQKK